MPPYGVSLGNLSSALRLTGGDESLARRLLAEEEQQQRHEAVTAGPVNDAPIVERGLPDNPYNEPGANPYQRGAGPADDGVMRDFEPERVVARPKEQRSPYDSPEIQAALERVGMAPKTYGGSAPNGQVPGNPYDDQQPPIVQQNQRTASLGSQDLAMGAPQPRAPQPAPSPVQQALQRTQPAPVQLPPDTQQALQRTGSQYQLPNVQGVDPRSSVRALQLGQVDGYNDRIGLAQRSGEVAGNTNAAQGKVYSDAATDQGARNAVSDQRQQGMLDRTDANRQDAYAKVDKIRELAANRPGKQSPTASKIAEIGMMIPGLNILAAPAYGILRGRDKDAQREWAQNIDSAATAQKADTAMNASEHDDRNNELSQEQRMALLRDGQKLNQLEAIAKAGDSEQSRLKASNDALALKDRMADMLIGIKTGDQKKAAAGSRSAEDTRITQLLSQVPDAERPDLAMKLGPRAVELLGKAAKNTTAVVGMGKDLAQTEGAIAEAAHKRNEAAAGPRLSDGDKKLQRLAEGVRPAYDALSKYAAQIGKGTAEVPYVGIGPGATTMFAGEDTQGLNGNIQQLANVLLRDESGANLPESEQKTKWDAWGITSPDAAVRNRGLGKMLAEYEGRVSHVAPVGGPAPAAPAAAGPKADYSRDELEAELRRRRAQAGR
jgi:hypothetical protein